MGGRRAFPRSWAPAVRPVDGGYRLRVKVAPGASRTRVDGVYGELLKVRVTAPPEKGKANRAVEALLSLETGLRARVISGHSSPRKEVEFAPGRDNL